ncbi:uracil-DNA glycosylase [Rhodobacteraceae bacterium]|nr:uracil-DNA glycosylase [Paracoccaceae bacterium]
MAKPNLGAWGHLPFFSQDWPRIQTALAAETRPVLPPEPDRFKALELTKAEHTRVVILGQDPYPTPGHAMGLAFSVTKCTKIPKSLVNIYKEMEDDLGDQPNTGDLTPWATSGVLLLNTALSVPAHSAGGHAKLGWSTLTEQVLHHLSDRPRAFLLWGKHAQSFTPHIKGDGHFILKTPHPSPLSAYRGFFGSKPFSQINHWLTSNGQTPIPWTMR